MDILSRKEFLSLKLFNGTSMKLNSYEQKIMDKHYANNFNDFKLYNYQLFVVRYMDLFSNIKRYIIKWGTGSGKTKVSLVCGFNYLKLGGKKVYIIGLTKNIFIKELINDPNFGITNNELIKEMNMMFGTDEYYIYYNRLKKVIENKGWVFMGYEKLYHMLTNTEVEFENYDDFKKGVSDGVIIINRQFLKSMKGSFIILDEAHKFYNSKEKNTYGIAIKYILDTLKDDVYVLFLSATLSNNDPAEIIDVASLLDYNFNGTKDEFFEEKNDINVLKPGALEKLRKVFYGKVSYYETRDPKLYPKQTFMGDKVTIPKDVFGNTSIPLLTFVQCEMVGIQLKEYKRVCQDFTLPNDNKYVLDYVNNKGSSYLDLKSDPNAKTIGDDFIISIKDPGDSSSKYKKLLELLKGCNGKKVIYHPNRNVTGVLMIYDLLINNGWTPYGSYPTMSSLCLVCDKRLDEHNNDHEFVSKNVILIDGTITKEQRDKYFLTWSSEANTYGTIIDTMVGSQVIEESIDMKAVMHLFVMFLPKNMALLMQLFGRSTRSGSHLALPKELREVKVYIMVSSLKGEVSYEEHRYHIMTLKFLINREINTMLDSCSLDLWVNQDQMINDTNVLADVIHRVNYVPKKVDNRYFEILYKQWEISAIEGIILATFEITPVWKLKDLIKEVKSTHINIQFNPSYIEDNNILIALSNLVNIPRLDNYMILSKGDYFIKTSHLNYNFLSSLASKVKEVNLSEELDTKIDYESMKVSFYKMNRKLSIQKMTLNLDKFSRSFHIKYVQEIIEYLFGILKGNPFSEKHGFMLNVLYFYDKLNLLIYASQVEQTWYDDLILKDETSNPFEKHKTLLYTSLTNSLSQHPVFDKFNELLKKKKINPDVLPVGHYMDYRAFLYNPKLTDWVPYIFKMQHSASRLNDVIIGYFERGNNITFDFKVRFPGESNERDKRAQKKGNKCNTLYKDVLTELIRKLNIKTEDHTIDSLCDQLKKELIRRELKNSGVKWFFFHFEKLPW